MPKDPFETIGEDAVRAAEEVKVSLEKFEEGLTTIRDAIQERLDLARDELRGQPSPDDDEDDEEDDGT